MRVRLLAMDDSLLESLTSRDAFRRRVGSEVGEHVELARAVVEQTLDLVRRLEVEAPWGGYLVVEEESNAVVGAGGFKGSPNAAAEVEIAYYTFPTFEGRGIAGETAARLLEVARAGGGVRRVIAHTLPERNASCRILEKRGFELDGEVVDPEDGLVWRWSRELGGEA